MTKKSENRRAEILRFLRGGPKSWGEIQRKTGLSPRGVKIHLDALKEAKLAEQDRERRYGLTPKGRKLHEIVAAQEILSLEEVRKVLKRGYETGLHGAADIFIEEMKLHIGLLFIFNRELRALLRHPHPLPEKKLDLFSNLIYAVLKGYLEKSPGLYLKDSNCFFLKIMKQEEKQIRSLVNSGRFPDDVHVLCSAVSQGLAMLDKKGDVSFAVSQDKVRWPYINKAWEEGKWGKDPRAMVGEGLDLLEREVAEEATKHG